MVTLQQARQQIDQRREQIQQLRLQNQSPQQVRQRGRAQIIQREQQEQNLRRAKELALQKLKPLEERISKAESKVKEAQQFSKDLIQARRAFIRKQPFLLENEQQKDLFNKFKQRQEGEIDRLKLEKLEEARKSGGKFELSQDANEILKGKIFEGLPAIKSKNIFLSSEQLKTIAFGGKGSVEKAIFEMPSLRLPTAEEVSKTLTVEVAPSKFNQLRNALEEYKEDIKGRRPISGTLSFASGLEDFALESTKGGVVQLSINNPTLGFTPKQAAAIGELGFTIGEQYLLGAGAGKVFTLGRGGVALVGGKVVPKSGEVANALRNIGAVTELSILGGLTTAEIISLNNTLKNKGQREFTLQLIGLASFGKGFSTTGLKGSVQAQKEFKEFAETFRIRGKKGSIQLLRQVSKFERQKAEAKLKAIQKRIASKKTLEEQLKELAKIRKQLKDPKAIENFNKFVKDELVDKEILKVPKERVKGEGFVIDVKGEPIPTIKKKVKTKTKTLPKLQSQLEKNKQRIAQAQKPLGQRYKEAQQRLDVSPQKSKVLTSTVVSTASLTAVASVQKTLQAQKERLKTLQAQKASQLQISEQKQRIRTIQSSLSSLKQRQLEKERFSSRKRTSGRRGRISALGFPILPPPFSGGKKKKVLKTKSTFPSKSLGYLAFAKQRGKLIRISKVPVKKKVAKDQLAFFLDKTLSASGKIKKSNKSTKNPILKVPQSYFGKNKIKFRDFRKIKGKKIPLDNGLIEKRKYRLDAPKGEKQTIQQLKRKLLRKQEKRK